MKEYIPLEWFEDFIVGQNLAWDGREIPTVTKADIVSDVVNESVKIIRHRLEGYLIDIVCEQIKELAEMEQGETK